jgi:hypothetical protein
VRGGEERVVEVRRRERQNEGWGVGLTPLSLSPLFFLMRRTRVGWGPAGPW